MNRAISNAKNFGQFNNVGSLIQMTDNLDFYDPDSEVAKVHGQVLFHKTCKKNLSPIQFYNISFWTLTTKFNIQPFRTVQLIFPGAKSISGKMDCLTLTHSNPVIPILGSPICEQVKILTLSWSVVYH